MVPVLLDCNFVVDPANGNGLGIRNLKGPGILNVFMNSTSFPPPSIPFSAASSYAIIGASAISNTGSSVLSGNIALTPGSSVTGFPPGTFSGTLNVDNAQAIAAQASAQGAYTSLFSTATTTIPSALDGQTLAPGAYSFASGAATLATSAPGTLTLNGGPTSIFVIKTASTLTTGAGGAPTIALTGGAVASNVFWIVGSSATLNSGTAGTFNGNVIAQNSITVTNGGTINGTLSALTGAVTLGAATVINAVPFSGTSTLAHPNPAPGIILVQLAENYNRYYGGFAGFEGPLSDTPIAVATGPLAIGGAYVIVSVGTTTQAQWAALGLNPGNLAAPGVAFVAIAATTPGTGAVETQLASGVDHIELVGDPNATFANQLSVQSHPGTLNNLSEKSPFLTFFVMGPTSSSVTTYIPTAPAIGTTIGMAFYLSNSSVLVKGE